MQIARTIRLALAALLAAAALALAPGCESGPPTPCPAGFEDCDENLSTGVNGCEADVRADPKNCGACGKACGGKGLCASSACACGPGAASCSGACVDTMADPMNCGGCGTVCPGGSSCAAGSCTCPSGLLCSGVCVPTQTDAANCGACGHACPPGVACSKGTCACPGGGTACGSACVDTRTDALNCGGCGKTCPKLNQACSGAQCACPGGMDCSCDVPANGGTCDLAPQCGCGASEGCYPDGPNGANTCETAGTTQPVGTCTKASDCAAGSTCVIYGNMGAIAAAGLCKTLCASDADCPGSGAGRCSPYTNAGGTSIPGARYCLVGCDPASPTNTGGGFLACPASTTCWLAGAAATLSDCDFPAGNGTEGAACAHLWECAPGYFCHSGGTCTLTCTSNADCPGKACHFYWTVNGVQLGDCE